MCHRDFHYICIKPLKDTKDKKHKTALNAFIKKVNESNHKPNQLWYDQGR